MWVDSKDDVSSDSCKTPLPSSHCSCVVFKEMTGPQQAPVFKAAASVFLGKGLKLGDHRCDEKNLATMHVLK